MHGRDPLHSIDTILPYRPDMPECAPVSAASRHGDELVKALNLTEQERQKGRLADNTCT